MRPEVSTTTPLPRRSLPRIRVDGCSRPTVVWMYTTLCRRCLTSSTELSMAALSDLQMIAEEFRDPAARVRKRAGVEGDGSAATVVRLVAIGHLGQIGARLADHIEVVVGLRVEHDASVRAAPPHGFDHLDAWPRNRPVVGVADEHQERVNDLLVNQRVASAGVERHRGPEAGLGHNDAAPPRAIETRPVDD